MTLSDGRRKQGKVSAYAIDAGYDAVQPIDMLYGRMINESDVEAEAAQPRYRAENSPGLFRHRQRRGPHHVCWTAPTGKNLRWWACIKSRTAF